MDWDRSLREQIVDRIEPWRQSEEKPPFTGEQLVVMALVDYGEPVTALAIYEWHFNTFLFHRRLAVSHMWERHQQGRCDKSSEFHDPWEMEKFDSDFRDAFHQLEVPLKKIGTDEDTTWTVSTSEARFYFHAAFEDEQGARDQCFPLMRLPPEIRLRIYQLVFALPRSGVRLGRVQNSRPFAHVSPSSRSALAITRDFLVREAYSQRFPDATERPLSSHRNGEPSPLVLGGLDPWRYMECGTATRLLSLLSTNKVIHEEALPVFYDINKFVFPSLHDMFATLDAFPCSRRKYIKHILLRPVRGGLSSNTIRGTDLWMCRRRLLQSCTGLSTIDVSTHGWTEWDIDALTRHEILFVLSVLDKWKIRFLGDCSAVQAALESELTTWKGWDPSVGWAMICS